MLVQALFGTRRQQGIKNTVYPRRLVACVRCYRRVRPVNCDACGVELLVCSECASTDENAQFICEYCERGE